jgi:hypothetical protein
MASLPLWDECTTTASLTLTGVQHRFTAPLTHSTLTSIHLHCILASVERASRARACGAAFRSFVTFSRDWRLLDPRVVAFGKLCSPLPHFVLEQTAVTSNDSRLFTPYVLADRLPTYASSLVVLSLRHFHGVWRFSVHRLTRSHLVSSNRSGMAASEGTPPCEQFPHLHRVR